VQFQDLAGSERQSRTGASGVTLKEGQNINKSLLVLGSCVNALNSGSSKARVPYRDSKLTRLLQDSLGGTAKMCFIICCSPAMNNSSETLSSLRFGAHARAIESKAYANVISQGPASLAAAQVEISALKTAAEAAEQETARCVAKRDSLHTMVWAVAIVLQAAGVIAFFAAENFIAKYCEI
jgi:hypothetical protein